MGFTYPAALVDAHVIEQAGLRGHELGLVVGQLGDLRVLLLDGGRLAVQLLGQAVSYYRKRGRRALRLRVSPDNAAALKFYADAGFAETLREDGSFGPVVTMCMDI